MSLSAITSHLSSAAPVESQKSAPAAALPQLSPAVAAPKDTVSISPAAHQASSAADRDGDGH